MDSDNDNFDSTIKIIKTTYPCGLTKQLYCHDENNFKIGIYQKWHNTGEKYYICEYIDGKLNGKYEKWYENGHRDHICEYIDGKLNGKYETWYENEQRYRICEYVNGKRNGKHEAWYENGQCDHICEYIDGKLNGKYETYNIYGIKLFEGEFKNDVPTNIIAARDNKGRNCILDDGVIEVWKACRSYNNKKCVSVNVYVKLSVPRRARRVTLYNICGYSSKSRVEYAQVVNIVDEFGNHYEEALSFVHKNKLVYHVGKIVLPDKFDDNINNKCSHGINVHLYKDQCDQWFK
jgi:antitoxin component YwqK of YwqJK toxin-antitoxin module